MDVLCFFSRFPRPLRSRKLLATLFLYRLVLCLTVRTAESPDEWWQSEEVAYFMVFGRGQLTWEWVEGIRSYFFPFLFALPLYLLKWSGMDTALTVWASSRCVQSLIFFLHDYVTLALAQYLDCLVHKARKNAPPAAAPAYTVSSRSPTIASATLAMLVVEWFLNYDGVRCYSNVAESLFFLLALYQQTYQGFLLCAGLACAVRVTAAFALLPVFVLHTYHICRQKGLTRGISYILLITFGMVLGIGVAVCVIDMVFYGRFVITPLQFLKFNILKDISRYYGVHPFYWYVVVLPALAAPFSLFVLWWPSVWGRLPSEKTGQSAVGCALTSLKGSAAPSPAALSRPSSVQREMRRWACVMVFTLLCHSAVPHKEMRFVYLLLPLVLLVSSVVVMVGCTTVPTPAARRWHWYGLRVPCAHTIRRLFNTFWFASALLLLFLLYGYRCGGPTIFREVRNAPRHFDHLEILTHCYATPGYSHLHKKVRLLEWVDCPMKLDSKTQVREVTQDRLFTEQQGPYALWRYLRKRSRLTFPVLSAKRESSKLSEEVWWREAERLMPATVAPALPDGLILFHNTARTLEEDLLVPMGYHLDRVVAHAPYSFEPNEDRTMELWVRDTL
ncbi:putative GPI anchor biosynthesis protein [Leptomonas seymouri]|uniref:Mannosyltransferase n=1 Tax=Leptomonas seymouri TaxID=5684 RepID=A0A0N0P5Q8_LEPSE|nr:putative GPI anchor biosynthesis protein [Leptomonas seymouri]|eukprot:KPI86749.1 putative GPI anchor biosynthesis protein [Leptomonas seymouri]